MSHAPSHAGLDHDPAWGNVAVERLLVAAVGSMAGGLAMICGGLLLARRLSGGMTAPPGPLALAAVCGVGGLLVAVGDLASRHGGGGATLPSRVGFALAAVAMALPLPAGPSAALLMAVLTVGLAVVLLVQPWAGPWLGMPRPPQAMPIVREPSPPPEEPVWVARDDDSFSGWHTAEEHVLQQQQRCTRADGSECVRGKLFLAVPTGVRTASGHVGFCPPFATIPTVDVTTAYDEVEAIVAAAEVLPWGVRVECRLDEPADEPFEIPIDIIATSPPPFPDLTTPES